MNIPELYSSGTQLLLASRVHYREICLFQSFNSHNHDSGKQYTNPMIDVISRKCEVLCLCVWAVATVWADVCSVGTVWTYVCTVTTVQTDVASS